ncbi:MAG: hypothetical protein IJV58_05355, partial [Oscillospiraceae bacterium]|nr:hypothetical protein [Oscillospiraceae bacterium]
QRMPMAIETLLMTEDIAALTAILPLIPAEQIDECITMAIRHTHQGGNPEIQMLLTRRKHEITDGTPDGKLRL